jgi:uncharacterized Zn finger protein (UPF0148 family)
MVKKYCPKCKCYSYSAFSEGKWICPICGNDITNRIVLALEENDQDKENSFVLAWEDS